LGKRVSFERGGRYEQKGKKKRKKALSCRCEFWGQEKGGTQKHQLRKECSHLPIETAIPSLLPNQVGERGERGASLLMGAEKGCPFFLGKKIRLASREKRKRTTCPKGPSKRACLEGGGGGGGGRRRMPFNHGPGVTRGRTVIFSNSLRPGKCLHPSQKGGAISLKKRKAEHPRGENRFFLGGNPQRRGGGGCGGRKDTVRQRKRGACRSKQGKGEKASSNVAWAGVIFGGFRCQEEKLSADPKKKNQHYSEKGEKTTRRGGGGREQKKAFLVA